MISKTLEGFVGLRKPLFLDVPVELRMRRGRDSGKGLLLFDNLYGLSEAGNATYHLGLSGQK